MRPSCGTPPCSASRSTRRRAARRTEAAAAGAALRPRPQPRLQPSRRRPVLPGRVGSSGRRCRQQRQRRRLHLRLRLRLPAARLSQLTTKPRRAPRPGRRRRLLRLRHRRRRLLLLLLLLLLPRRPRRAAAALLAGRRQVVGRGRAAAPRRRARAAAAPLPAFGASCPPSLLVHRLQANRCVCVLKQGVRQLPTGMVGQGWAAAGPGHLHDGARL